MSLTVIKPNKQRVDQLVIGAGHSIMLNNVPEVVSTKDNLTFLNEHFFEWSKANKESLQSFGLFGDIDYNTYYPGLDLADLKPKDEEFIHPLFRLLSATIVSKNWAPTDFGKGGVLKASMGLLLGQTVNCDHETNIGNAIGAVSKVIWQDAYEDSGIKIPAGINGILKIDGKANPRIARGILMDPPSIHSNSVTVQFKWDKSHPNMADNEFRSRLGEYDAKGQMICRVCTEIIRYAETSLVSHGADAYAQKIGQDGKLVNPVYANRVWNSYKEEDASKQYLFIDNVNDTQQSNNEINNKENQKTMDELEVFLQELFAENMLTLEEGKTVSKEEAISLISNLISDKNSLSETVTQLEEKVNNLTSELTEANGKVEAMKEMATLGEETISKLREKAIDNYKKIQGDSFNESDPVYVMLSTDKNLSHVSIKGLNASYEQRLEELFPMKCSECGSNSISRASSREESKEPEQTKNSLTEVKSTAEALGNLINRKNSYQPTK